jgi:hypothetical protein
LETSKRRPPTLSLATTAPPRFSILKIRVSVQATWAIWLSQKKFPWVDYCFSGDGVATTVCSIERGGNEKLTRVWVCKMSFFSLGGIDEDKMGLMLSFLNCGRKLVILNQCTPSAWSFVSWEVSRVPTLCFFYSRIQVQTHCFFSSSARFSSTSHLLWSFLECIACYSPLIRIELVDMSFHL